MADFVSKFDITTNNTYPMEIQNGDSSRNVANSLAGKFNNIQNYLQGYLPEVVDTDLPTSLPNGKLICNNDTWYYGKKSGIPNKLSSTVRVYETAAIQVSGTISKTSAIPIEIPSVPNYQEYDVMRIYFFSGIRNSLSPSVSLGANVDIVLGNVGKSNNGEGIWIMNGENKTDVREIILFRTYFDSIPFFTFLPKSGSIEVNEDGIDPNSGFEIGAFTLKGGSDSYTFTNNIRFEFIKYDF